MNWPSLHYDAWRDTCTTLHLFTQVVGKIRLATAPWLNHSWHVPLYVDARGLTTSLMSWQGTNFEMRFDFIDDELVCATSDGRAGGISLGPQSIAQFKDATMRMLDGLGIHVAIRDLPCEIEGAIAFSQDDARRAYDGGAARRFHGALCEIDRVLKQFRTGFIGKGSPVHFFWGSFDLAVTRFSGRRAPLFQGTAPGVAPIVMQEAYSHEVSSAGFWPGGAGIDASFYSYCYPTAPAFSRARVRPDAAFWSDALGEFLLPYEAVRRAADPDAALLAFLHSSYDAAAETLAWDRAAPYA